MSHIELVLAFAVGIETPTILAAIYFLNHKVKAVAPAVQATAISKPAASAQTKTAVTIAAPKTQVSATQAIATCVKCGHFVARYTSTVAGAVCANCQPLK